MAVKITYELSQNELREYIGIVLFGRRRLVAFFGMSWLPTCICMAASIGVFASGGDAFLPLIITTFVAGFRSIHRSAFRKSKASDGLLKQEYCIDDSTIEIHTLGGALESVALQWKSAERAYLHRGFYVVEFDNGRGLVLPFRSIPGGPAGSELHALVEEKLGHPVELR